MYKKIANYFKSPLDYPLEYNTTFINKKGLDYHLNLCRLKSQYLLPNLNFDQEGIPRFNYSAVPPPNNKVGLVYNITYITWYALARLQDYIETKEESAKIDFLRQADWLLRNKSISGGVICWQIRFPWSVYGVQLAIPRVSSMDQGLAISVLVRAYLLTSHKEYLEVARLAELFYDRPIQKGGFRFFLRDNTVFYEMYPSRSPSLILDGHIFSLMGLYDLYSITSSVETKKRFDCGLEAIIKNIRYWDYCKKWSWFGRFFLSSPMYHKINFCWLKILSRISKSRILEELCEGWRYSKDSEAWKFYLKSSIFLSCRFFFLTKARADFLAKRILV